MKTGFDIMIVIKRGYKQINGRKVMAQEPKYPVQTVMKALNCLNYLAKNTGNLGAGVSEIC